MTTVHGFTLKKETRIDELDSTARIWQHTQTHSELLSITNNDENKVFGVTLRTPPSDSTGLPHILEHSVLCGSKKYPVKEPFVALLKGSLQTFLNAFTYPDKTCYPVASCNLKDFRNLTDVYLDAVFFPRISKEIFGQEGWHFEAESTSSPLSFKGVVYNEMKGAFSAPESVLARFALHALFPDTVYALESGGDPKDIPSLSYEQFIAFHQSYYHPSNARFFFWGDDNEEERLAQLNGVLQQFSAKTIDSGIGLQQPISAPRTISVPFAASEGEKGMATLNWLLPETADMECNLAMRMLEHILLGMPASPLRRALIESGLGEDMAGQGLETELRQMTFDIGLKGIAPDKASTMEACILDTLEQLVSEGIPAASIDAAVNSIEFALRENNTGRFPLGLSVMLRSLTTWLHDGDPISPLAFEQPLAAIKQRIAAGERYFEQLLNIWLLQNTHRITVVLAPDADLESQQAQEEQARLETLAAAMTAEERQQVLDDVQALQKWQQTPDTEEALATIPRLAVADLPTKNQLIPSTTLAQEPLVYYHPLPTAGIAYVEVCFALDAVPAHLLPLLPLFGRALVEAGTQQQSFIDLNMSIARHTGGIDIDPIFLTHMESKEPIAKLVVSAKAAPDKLQQLFALLTEILTQYDLNQPERFAAIVLEEKARQEHGLIPAGHTAVAARLRASLSPAGWLSEQTGGIEALFALRTLATQTGDNWASVQADLQTLAEAIITQQGLSINITALPEQETELLAAATQLAQALPKTSTARAQWKYQTNMANEALIVPAQVNYVGKAINLFAAGYTWHGSAAVIMKYLRTGYLWEKVRVQGGAYGCFCSLDRMSGTFALVSYRDPNVLPTLQVYDALAQHLTEAPIDLAELNAAIVGAIGELDSYLLPDAKGSTAFMRHLCGDSAAIRQQLRDEILATTADDVHRFGQALTSFASQGRICALGGSAVQAAAQELDWLTTKIL